MEWKLYNCQLCDLDDARHFVGRQEMSAETSMFDKIGSLMISSSINVEYALTVGSV